MSAYRLVLRAALLLPTSALPTFAMSAFAMSAFALAQDEPSRSPNPLASLDKATLRDFVEKPLFEPSRHPPVIAAPIVAVPSRSPMVEQPPSLRLIGIVEGSRSLAAIVHRNDTGKTETVRQGDHIGTWTIEVMPASLRVVNGDRAFDYAMFRGSLRQGPTVAARDPGTSGAR